MEDEREFEDDQAVGDYEINGPDQITWSDIQEMENRDLDVDYIKEDWESDDNRFAGLNSHGNDLFGRYGW